jgi:hypothetical protein
MEIEKKIGSTFKAKSGLSMTHPPASTHKPQTKPYVEEIKKPSTSKP